MTATPQFYRFRTFFLPLWGVLCIAFGTASAQLADPQPWVVSVVPGVPLVVTHETSVEAESSGAAAPAATSESGPVGASKRPRSIESIIACERVPLGQLVDAHAEFYPHDSYLLVGASTNRVPVVPGPFGLRLRPAPGSSRLPGAVPATEVHRYGVDSSVSAVAEWYSREYGFEFNAIVSSFREGATGESIRVMQGVRRIGNAVVSIMIWSPSYTPRKRSRGIVRARTTVEIQERVFRPREDLIVEGPDAVVAFDWNVPYRSQIVDASRRYQIDPYLIAALIQQESNFDPNALSVDSALGLTQMIPSTALAMGVTNPSDPRQAIDGGVRYLKMMLARFGGDPLLALAAYNAGPGNVVRFNGVPPFAETREYVRRILDRYREKAAGSRASNARLVRASVRG